VLAAALAAAPGALAACDTTSLDGTAAAPTVPSAYASASSSATPGTAPVSGSEVGGQLPAPAPGGDEASRTSALVAGRAAVAAYARPDLPAGRWYDELAPLLTQAAQNAYLDTDPAEIPAHAVTGEPALDATSSALSATVRVPTDAGEYAVLLVRDSQDAPWLAERITRTAPGTEGPVTTGPLTTGPSAAP
jgi:hypothetical protein